MSLQTQNSCRWIYIAPTKKEVRESFFGRYIPNPIAVIVKNISYTCWRLGLIANAIATVVIHPISGVVVVLAIVVVIRGVVVVIRTIVVVILTVVVVIGRVFPTSDLCKAVARDCKTCY